MPRESDASKFLAVLQSALTSSARKMIGNTSLRRDILKWRNEERYWKAHTTLRLAGRIVTGRGRGGSVGLAPGKRSAA